MQRFIALIFLFFVSSVATAQLEYSVRAEFKTNNSIDEDFDVLPLAKDGLLVTHKKDAFFGNEKWDFCRYDSTLKERWKVEYKLEDEAKALRFFHNQSFLFWLFKDTDHSEKFTVLRLDLTNGEIDIFKGKFPSETDISHFKVLGNLALIGGHYNNRPVVMAFSFFDKSIRTLPYLFLPNTEINGLEIDEKRNEIRVILYSLEKRVCQLLLKTYSYEAKLLRTINLPTEDKNSFISGKTISLSNGHSLLVGNYAQGCTQYSQGIYLANIKEENLDQIQWVDFSQLENFFNYLKPKRKQRMVDKINRQKESGREPKFKYRLMVHDILETPDEYVMIAEIFYPSFTQINSSFTNTMSRRFGDVQNYRYTHAFVCGIDKKSGKLLWDNCFGLGDVETFQVLEIAQITQQNGKLILAYPDKDKINTTVIEKNKILRSHEEYDIKPAADNEKITDNNEEQLAAWYDNHFLLFGYQKIAVEKGTNRDVFFVNKVSYNTNKPPKTDSPKP